MSKSKHMPKLWIDGETADRITLTTLTDYRKYLKSELKKWKDNPKTDTNPEGYWLHSDDVAGNIRRIEALNLIIKDYTT
jgi:hypothetical protein